MRFCFLLAKEKLWRVWKKSQINVMTDVPLFSTCFLCGCDAQRQSIAYIIKLNGGDDPF